MKRFPASKIGLHPFGERAMMHIDAALSGCDYG